MLLISLGLLVSHRVSQTKQLQAFGDFSFSSSRVAEGASGLRHTLLQLALMWGLEAQILACSCQALY